MNDIKKITNQMQALRNIYTVKNNRITIDLPDFFKYSAVEIIILPIEKAEEQKKENPISKNEHLEELLSVGTWTDEDIKAIIDSQKLINQWNIDEF